MKTNLPFSVAEVTTILYNHALDTKRFSPQNKIIVEASIEFNEECNTVTLKLETIKDD